MTATLRARGRRAGSRLWLAALLVATACSGGSGGAESAESAASAEAPGAAQAASTPATAARTAPLAGQDCLILVLDALHARHLGCYGESRDPSPAIDALAARGVRFTRAWSQTSWTLPSTACLMTGLYQESHGVTDPQQVLGEDADTLAEAFARAGYETLAFTQNPYASASFGLAQGFRSMELLPGTDAKTAPGQPGTDVRMADAVLAALAPRDASAGGAARPPRFVYAHFRRPHMPYDAPPEQRARFCDPAYGGSVTGTEDDQQKNNHGQDVLRGKDLAHLKDLYLAGVHTADEQVGRILAGIDAAHTLVLLLSDHGEALNEHNYLGHNFNSYEEMVHIAFLAAHPSLAARSVDVPVMTIDVYPTLAELFGLDVDRAQLPGRSLMPELSGVAGAPRAAVFTSSRKRTNQMFAVFDGQLKYLTVPSQKREVLFDLLADPAEQHDLAPARPEDVARLRTLLAGWRAEQRPRVTPGAARPDAQVDAELQALGYVGHDR